LIEAGCTIFLPANNLVEVVVCPGGIAQPEGFHHSIGLVGSARNRFELTGAIVEAGGKIIAVLVFHYLSACGSGY